MSRAFPIISCELCHILQRLYLYSSNEYTRTCACCTAVGRRSESPDSYYPSLADEQLMNTSIPTAQTSYMTAPEYLDDESDAGYEADDEEDSDDQPARRNSYDSLMDFLRRTYAETVQCQGLSASSTPSEDDEMVDGDILSAASESRASTPEWLDEPSIPPFMVPYLAYTPDHSHLFPGAMSSTDSYSTYTSSTSSCSTPATSPPHPWSTMPPNFSQSSFSSSSQGSSAFETPSPPPFTSHRKSLAYPGEPGYDPHDHPEYILFGIQPDRRQPPVELVAPAPKRPVQEKKLQALCEQWGKEEVVQVGGEWGYHDGETTQQQVQEEAFFHWWREEERRAWEMFDVDAMYGIQDTYGQGCNAWGSEGLPGGQGRMMGLCC
ncbi:MAG: hypothetical protein OHK93_001711 [Ramalina farinacea]|uniref:Uncharacterized protein n=1 Tax=Ramalina farinacea TaxID=258253 RepID=A0AA43QQX3_9LECA|nr:hypothetical protein [Ramalina farinacea]